MEPALRVIAAESLDFREIYRTYVPFVWRLVRRFGVAPADVEDICQEVFTVVHRKLPGFDRRSSVRTWLYGIAFRCASEYRRRAVRREVPLDLADNRIVPASQLDRIERKQVRALLDAMLDALDEDKRVVFVLYELEEVDMSEIAEIVGCPVQTAYSRLHAAQKALEKAAARLEAKEARR